MIRKYRFISGLPRSGSTLLTSILKQNPRFTAEISDPLHGYVKSITQVTNASVGMDAMVGIEKRRQLMRGLFDTYYQDSREVCFNTNRGWSSETSLLKDLYSDFKIIVCIRDIPWILDSFERLHSNNPYTIKPLYHHQDLGNVYDRSHMLMGNMPNFLGYVDGPLANVRHSMFCDERDRLLYVEYEHLVKHPDLVIKQIYNFLEEPIFQHDFDNVENSYDEFDAQAKITGLHSVRKKITWIDRRTVLPDDLWRQYEQSSFWKHNFEHNKRHLHWSMQGISQQNGNIPRLNKQL